MTKHAQERAQAAQGKVLVIQIDFYRVKDFWVTQNKMERFCWICGQCGLEFWCGLLLICTVVMRRGHIWKIESMKKYIKLEDPTVIKNKHVFAVFLCQLSYFWAKDQEFSTFSLYVMRHIRPRIFSGQVNSSLSSQSDINYQARRSYHVIYFF